MSIKQRLVFIILIIIILPNCLKIKPKTKIEKCTDELKENRNLWIKYYNSGSDKISKLYIKDGALFTENSMTSGNENVSNFLLNKNKLNIKSFKTEKIILHDLNNILELGFLETDDFDKIYYLTAWNKINGFWLRELDVLYPKNNVIQNTNKINLARLNWVEMLKAHDIIDLVDCLYLKNSIYFYNGKINHGRENVVKAFIESGMAEENFNMNLHPIDVLLIQEKVAFESGEYLINNQTKGHYLLVWNKDEDDSWKIVLDFNF